MSKFKRIFYIICLVYFLIVIFIVLFQKDIMFEIDSVLYMGRIGLAIFLIKFGGIGLGLFITELITENIHISTLKNSIATLEKEKMELKAKLYDKKENEEKAGLVESEAAIEKKDPDN